MLVIRIDTFEALMPFEKAWDDLTGDCLFRSWDWLSTWWQHYGHSHQLFVLLCFDEESSAKDIDEIDSEKLIGIFPAYIDDQLARGKRVRLLGDGEVCSDQLDILATAQNQLPVASAAAQYLFEHAELWDATYFNAISQDCEGLSLLGSALEKLGCDVSMTQNVNRWSIPLSGDWEQFLAMQSKSHRKKLRRLARGAFATETANWHLVETEEQFEAAWPILIDLHQRRRISLGERGCFSSGQWAEFHHQVAKKLLAKGQLRLSWTELNGRPISAEYQFASSCSTYAYQSGLNPEYLEHQPGRLSLLRSIQHAIKEGHTEFDLMRGDEPYKTQWRAQPTATFDIRAVSPRFGAVVRDKAITCLKSAFAAVRSIPFSQVNAS